MIQFTSSTERDKFLSDVLPRYRRSFSKSTEIGKFMLLIPGRDKIFFARLQEAEAFFAGYHTNSSEFTPFAYVIHTDLSIPSAYLLRRGNQTFAVADVYEILLELFDEKTLLEHQRQREETHQLSMKQESEKNTLSLLAVILVVALFVLYAVFKQP